jgi:hypothetical protein
VKILVMGIMPNIEDKAKAENVASISEDQYGEYGRKFGAAAFSIGQALAEKGHTIVATAVSWERVKAGTSVVSHVIQGANAVAFPNGQQTQVTLYVPRDAEPDVQTSGAVNQLGSLRSLPNVNIDLKSSYRPVRISYRIGDVKVADAVIVLDGSAGVQQVAVAAYSLDKPLIPVTSLGALPRELYADLVGPEYENLRDRGEIPADALQAVRAPWSTDAADMEKNLNAARQIVRLAESLVAVNVRAARQNTTTLLATVGLTVLLPIMIWVRAFTLPSVQEQNWSLFFVLFLSVLPGVGLRTLVSYQQGSTARLTWQGILVDVAVAMAIAFGLALLFLIGDIVYSGELTVNFSEGADDEFARVAVIMSVLGLAAGYLVPLGRLRELLENSLAQQGWH